jgi:hypothetical protein
MDSRSVSNTASNRKTTSFSELCLTFAKLRLGDSLAHCGGRRHSSRHRHEQVINVFGSTPLQRNICQNAHLFESNGELTYLLVRQHIRAEVAFTSLDQFHICLHAFLREVFREQVRNIRIRVQPPELQEKFNQPCQRPA